ncbi:F-box protein at3g03040 [Phtheirospermum japonicum]|uniref:F-box protein at3g03040 n=1 Tax=Phtheirospermum japonicum TaxID=374723 RepID=A0A830CD28_9LAMI|nr:F-box protein at3g03040 [Phtheirospermum japonicum]
MHFWKGANIESWLEFALDRQVKIIDIRVCKMKITLNLSNLIGRPLPGLKCLKQLYFHGVHVDDLEVQLLLSNFPLLESLTIEFSRRLRNVLVVGHGMILKLKRLDISYAEYLESIEIRDMVNLVSFKCYGHRSRYVLRLGNLPKLIEFSTSEEHAKNTLAVVLPTIPSYIHDQLRLLKVWTHPPLIQTHLPAYELINVKHLELKVNIEARYSTIQLFPLIEACSSLEKLEIEFLWRLNNAKKLKDCEVLLFSPSKKKSPNLKKLTMSGYLGSTAELEFALVMMNKAASLEELSVEPCDLTPKIRRMATARAWKQFRPLTPNSVNLVIL